MNDNIPLVPDQNENIKNCPVAFLELMIPNLKVEPWQREILRNLEDLRWISIIGRWR